MLSFSDYNTAWQGFNKTLHIHELYYILLFLTPTSHPPTDSNTLARVLLPNELGKYIYDDYCEHQAINTVEHSTMAGHNLTAIFDMRLPLNQ